MLRHWLAILGLTISVSPTVSFAPATLQVKVTKVNQVPENRKLVWSIVNGDFGQESTWDLQGENTPKTLFLPPWKGVPPGTYVITATIYDGSGHALQKAVTQAVVKGFE